MDVVERSEQAAFLPELVEGILMQSIQSTLDNEVYGEHARASCSPSCFSCQVRRRANLDQRSSLRPFLLPWPSQVDEKVQGWVDEICESCMEGLHALKKPFKYIVTCAIVQKNGAAFHTAHSSYWDISSDNLCQVAWPTEKMREQQGSHMRCIVTAFGLTL